MAIFLSDLFMSLLSVLGGIGAIFTTVILLAWLYLFRRSQDDTAAPQAENSLRKVPFLKRTVELMGFELTEPSLSRLLSRSFPVLLFWGILIIGGAVFLGFAKPVVFRTTVGSLVVVLVSLVLFAAKIKTPLVYGSLEGVFALGSCVWSIDAKMQDKLTTDATITLFASIYLMIRAMDNIRKGLEERKKREAARKDEGNGLVSGTTSAA